MRRGGSFTSRTFSSRSPWQRAYAVASSMGRRRSRFRCPHTYSDTYQKDSPKESPGGPSRTALCDENDKPWAKPRESGGASYRVSRLAAPRAPVSTGADKVLVRCRGLRASGLAMAEQTSFGRAHLEQAEVLAVLCSRREAGLAPRHRDCLAAVVAEDVADRRFRGIGCPSAGVARLNRRPQCPDCVRRLGEAVLRATERELGCIAMLLGSQKRAMVLEEEMVLRYRRAAASLRSSRSSRVVATRSCVCLRGAVAKFSCIAAAAACVTRSNANRPTSRALRTITS